MTRLRCDWVPSTKVRRSRNHWADSMIRRISASSHTTRIYRKTLAHSGKQRSSVWLMLYILPMKVFGRLSTPVSHASLINAVVRPSQTSSTTRYRNETCGVTIHMYNMQATLLPWQQCCKFPLVMSRSREYILYIVRHSAYCHGCLEHCMCRFQHGYSCFLVWLGTEHPCGVYQSLPHTSSSFTHTKQLSLQSLHGERYRKGYWTHCWVLLGSCSLSVLDTPTLCWILLWTWVQSCEEHYSIPTVSILLSLIFMLMGNNQVGRNQYFHIPGHIPHQSYDLYQLHGCGHG